MPISTCQPIAKKVAELMPAAFSLLPTAVSAHSGNVSFHQNIATQQRTPSLGLQDSATPRQFRYERRHGEAPSRIFSSAEQPCAPPNLKENFHRSNSLETPLLNERKWREALRSSSSRPNVKASSQASSREPIHTVIQAKVRQTYERTLYSEADADNHLASLAAAGKILLVSINANRRRLPEGQLTCMKELYTDIKSLMQKIREANLASPETRKFQRQTATLADRVKSHLTEISKSYVRQMPPRPAPRKAQPPQTAIAIGSHKKHAGKSGWDVGYYSQESNESSHSNSVAIHHRQSHPKSKNISQSRRGNWAMTFPFPTIGIKKDTYLKTDR